MTMLRAACAALLLAAPVAAAATMYKWVDDRGVTTYGNVPPPGRAATRVVEDQRVSTVPAPSPAQLARERALVNDMRLASLERRVDALQSAPPAPTVVASPPSYPYFPPAVTYGYGYGGYPVAVGGGWGGYGYPGLGVGWRPGFPGRPFPPIANRQPPPPVVLPNGQTAGVLPMSGFRGPAVYGGGFRGHAGGGARGGMVRR